MIASVVGATVSILLLAVPSSGAITFADHGASVKTLSADEVRSASAPADIEVHEPHLDAKVKYRAVRLAPLLDAAYGPRWRKEEMLVATCADGYQPAISVEKIVAQKTWLAFAHADGSAFETNNAKQNEEHVALGPWYLVWEDNPAIRAEGGADWPYQVVGFDLADFATKFPKVGPPAGVAASVQRGFRAFRKHCLTCHTINGEGGAKAPELNYPVNVSEYYRESWMKKWIAEPTSIRFNTTMPALDPDVPDRARTIDDLVAYLKAMKDRKIDPKK